MQKYLLPYKPIFFRRSSPSDNYARNVGKQLKWDHNHKNIFLPFLKVRLQKGPSCTYENYYNEEQHTLKKPKGIDYNTHPWVVLILLTYNLSLAT